MRTDRLSTVAGWVLAGAVVSLGAVTIRNLGVASPAQHTVIGARIIASAPELHGVAEIVRSSHERYDGDGYPDRLAGEDIPLGARIVSICDAYDAMVRTRVYRRACSPHDALAELRRCAGSQFDPRVVAAFETVVTQPAPVPA